MEGPLLFFFCIYYGANSYNSFICRFHSLVVVYCTDKLEDTSSRLTQCERFSDLFCKLKNLKENLKFFDLYFLWFLWFRLEIYISYLGARPVLVRFWDYIFQIWITVPCLPHPASVAYRSICQWLKSVCTVLNKACNSVTLACILILKHLTYIKFYM